MAVGDSPGRGCGRPLILEGPSPKVSRDRQVVDAGRRLHPGKRPNPREHFLVERRSPIRLRLHRSRHRNRHRQDVMRIEARVGRLQRREAPDHQPRRDQQRERQRELGRHQRVAQAHATDAVGGCATALLEGADQALGHRVHRRSEPEREGREPRDREQEQRYRSVDRRFVEARHVGRDDRDNGPDSPTSRAADRPTTRGRPGADSPSEVSKMIRDCVSIPFCDYTGICAVPGRRARMPKVKANNITLNYDQQGTGPPLILIPYLAADCACYAFQVTEYAKRFTCISLDLRGTGDSDNPAGAYSTEQFADDIAAFMQVLGIPIAHIFGLSLGAAVGMWLAAKHPAKVKSLSLHSAWTKTDPFVKTVVEGWQVMATALDSVPEMIIQGMFPWCFTPELYAAKPEYIQSLAGFVRSRPAQPLAAFLQHSKAVIAHDITPWLSQITAPTQVTFGRYDLLTSTRFAVPMTAAMRASELYVFEGCSHAPIYEKVEEFNQKTLALLERQSAHGQVA